MSGSRRAIWRWSGRSPRRSSNSGVTANDRSDGAPRLRRPAAAVGRSGAAARTRRRSRPPSASAPSRSPRPAGASSMNPCRSSSCGRRYGSPSTSFHGIRLTCALPAREQPGQLAGVRRPVVQPAEDDVLVGHLPAGLREEVVGRGQDGGDAGLVVRRHDPVRSASFGACSDTARWYCLPASASRRILAGSPTVEMVTCRAPMPRPSLSAGDGEGRQQVVEVGQRLAHAHDDDVRQPLARAGSGSAAGRVVRGFRRPSGCGPRRSARWRRTRTPCRSRPAC